MATLFYWKAGWSGFLRHLKKCGLDGVELIISDACLGLVEPVNEFYSDAKWQRCSVNIYRNMFSVVSRGKFKHVAMMLKAIHEYEDREAAQDKAKVVIKIRGSKASSAPPEGQRKHP